MRWAFSPPPETFVSVQARHSSVKVRHTRLVGSEQEWIVRVTADMALAKEVGWNLSAIGAKRRQRTTNSRSYLAAPGARLERVDGR